MQRELGEMRRFTLTWPVVTPPPRILSIWLQKVMMRLASFCCSKSSLAGFARMASQPLRWRETLETFRTSRASSADTWASEQASTCAWGCGEEGVAG